MRNEAESCRVVVVSWIVDDSTAHHLVRPQAESRLQPRAVEVLREWRGAERSGEQRQAKSNR